MNVDNIVVKTSLRAILNSSVLMCVMLLVAHPAWAGSCKNTSRSGKMMDSSKLSADTLVKNQRSSGKYDVQILRGGTVKQSKTLSPGESVSHLATTSWNATDPASTLEVRVFKPGETSNYASCAYKVHDNNGSYVWKLAQDPICQNLSNICPDGDCDITCSKSFNKDKDKYKTHFTIVDM